MTDALACRSCGSAELSPVLSLGTTPLANALLTDKQLTEPEPVFPLEVALCSSCGLVQLREIVPPEALFREYVYLSSNSDAMVRHARASAEELIDARGVGSKSLVVEVASNDGYMLRSFAAHGIPVLGIEPARNIAAVAQERGVPTLPEFFNESLASEVRRTYGAADIILANNVLAHVPDINDFVRGIRKLLKEDGIFVVETPYIRDLVEKLEFDTIYHEHVFYYSMTALNGLFLRNGLSPLSVTRNPIHGGSLRLMAGIQGTGGDDGSVERVMADEERVGVTSAGFYHTFAQRVQSTGARLVELLRRLKSDGNRIAAYGAAAKGSTLLNHFRIGSDLLDFVVDRSALKQGLYMPGVHLPILPVERLHELRPEYVLLLTWNFADEILEQQKAYRESGGRFIIPIPEVRVV